MDMMLNATKIYTLPNNPQFIGPTVIRPGSHGQTVTWPNSHMVKQLYGQTVIWPNITWSNIYMAKQSHSQTIARPNSRMAKQSQGQKIARLNNQKIKNNWLWSIISETELKRKVMQGSRVTVSNPETTTRGSHSLVILGGRFLIRNKKNWIANEGKGRGGTHFLLRGSIGLHATLLICVLAPGGRSY